jgi:hypothetical protein
VTGALVFALLMLMVPGTWLVEVSLARSRVNLWALREHLSIVENKVCWLYRGPFQGTLYGHLIYRVVVVDREGLRRSAYIAVGGEFSGLLSRAFTVRWDDAR